MPATFTTPSLGSSRPTMCLIVTVFPAPVGPSSTVMAPAGTTRSTPSRTRSEPNFATTPWSSIAASGGTVDRPYPGAPRRARCPDDQNVPFKRGAGLRARLHAPGAHNASAPPAKTAGVTSVWAAAALAERRALLLRPLPEGLVEGAPVGPGLLRQPAAGGHVGLPEAEVV